MDTDGNVTGTPTVEQTSSFTVQVTDSLGGIDTLSCQLTVNPDCTTFADDFNRANGGLGSTWNTDIQSSGVAPQIVSNKYAASALSTSEVVADPGTNPTGHAECTWTGYTSIAWGGPMVLRNTNGINNNNYVLKAEDIGGVEPRGKLSIVRVYNTVITALATLSPTPLSGGLIGLPLRLEWDVQPTQVNLKGYINGVLVLSASDASAERFQTGKPGIGIVTTSAGTANTWDDFSSESCP